VILEVEQSKSGQNSLSEEFERGDQTLPYPLEILGRCEFPKSAVTLIFGIQSSTTRLINMNNQFGVKTNLKKMTRHFKIRFPVLGKIPPDMSIVIFLNIGCHT
jgi:hypothetical protein